MKSQPLQIKHSSKTVWRLSRKILVIGLAVLLLCWPVPNSVRAAAGDLDLTFGNDGKVITDFGNSGVDRAFALAIQTDGKMVVAGVGNQTSSSGFALARYNSDGSLDTSFGAGGKVITSFRDLGGEAHAVAIQSDGKIVAAGTAQTGAPNGERDFALARYNSDGSLDKSFGEGGKVMTDFLGSFDDGNAIALQSDGKIVVAGDAFGTAIFFALARYNSDGSLDKSFGEGGKVTTDFMGRLNQALIFSVQIQNDGKIVAAGRADDISSNFGLARYNIDGSLDESFGSGGKVTTDFMGNDEGHGLAIQSDGKLLVTGVANGSSAINQDFALARYNSDGSLDKSFGEGGKVITDFNTFFEGANAIVVQTNRKIVVAGGAGLGFALARYNPDGSLDESFGMQGKVMTPFNVICGTARAFALALQSDGKIVAAGDASECATGFNFALARYEGDGAGFDICLQDDGSGDILRFNSNTGDYQFVGCDDGLTLSGTGNLTNRGAVITLQHSASDRRVLAKVDGNANKGTASIQLFSLGRTVHIMDRNTINNTCACP